MLENLEPENTLQMLNQSGGFSISGMSFSLDLGHLVTKSVHPTTATIGQEVVYTIVVEHTGDFPLSGIQVLDQLPAGISVLGVAKADGVYREPSTADYTEQGHLILDPAATLMPQSSLTYYVKAFINTDAQAGDVLTNTAYTANVVSQQASASVSVEAVSASVRKIIGGNMADPNRKFLFQLQVQKGAESPHYPDQELSFELGHDETYHGLINLPSDGVIVFKENHEEYAITVRQGSSVIEPDAQGEYVIPLRGQPVHIEVENTLELPIPTGIQLDSWPFIVLLVLAVIGLLGFVVMKRKRSEDL